MTRTHRRSMIISLLVAAGSAYGQTHDQGTLDRQRDRLDDSSIASSTNGWLSDSASTRFWSWPTNSSVNDTHKHENLQRWVHIWFDSLQANPYVEYDSMTMTWEIVESELDNKAQEVADEIVDRLDSSDPDPIADGKYAFGFQNVYRLHLHTHPDDVIDTSVQLFNPDATPTPQAETWSSFITQNETASRGSPWTTQGVALTDEAMEYLTDEIVARVEAEISPDSFPRPIRFIFDEERNRQFGLSSLDNLGNIEAVTTDTPRVWTETLIGNFDLWDSSPSTTTALEVFGNGPLSQMFGWNDADMEYIPNEETPQHVAHNDPQYDYEFFPIYNTIVGILKTSVDGAFENGLASTVADSNWSSVKWSNYATSAYYSPTYPRMSAGRHGVLNWKSTSHQSFGMVQHAMLGSGDMQSPVLYPPSDFHEEELDADMDLGISDAARAWTRYSRMQLDHAIFSFPDLDDNYSFTSPRHITPWITRVGSYVIRPYQNGGDSNITTKANVRNIVALCKAKGINEIIFWGDPNSEANKQSCDPGTTAAQYRQFNWDATSDVLSQVYDYNLETVFVNGSSIGAEKADMLFSEEHTHDAAPVDLEVTIEAEFDTGSITTLGEKYTFVTEILDGGGPWEDATYTLEIYNYKDTQYETITDTPVTWYSNSTRRAIFEDDTPTNGYANSWERTHDDEGITDIDDVYDRKNILVWDQFDLATHAGGSMNLGEYTSSSSMRFRLTAEHTTQPTVGQTPDPLRVDLVQLYESECGNDNIPSMTLIAGDLNGDGQANYEDIKVFMDRLMLGNESGLDLNDDGRVDQVDLAMLTSMLNRG